MQLGVFRAWDLVGARKYRVKFDVKKCRGQLAVECGDDPAGGHSTLSAHQMAPGGVIPRSSSSELSAHQMPARLTSAKLHRIRLLFGAKTGKGRVRGHMTCLPHLTRILSRKGVERGRMMCLPLLPWITAFDDTVKSTYTEENATETGRQVREKLSARPHGVADAPLPVLYRLVNKDVVGPGIVGPDAKTMGPRPAQHPSGPRGARHDACADPRDALKNKTARTTTRTSRQFIW